MIKINQSLNQPLEFKTDCLILPCVENKKVAGELKEIDQKLAGAISQAFENKRFGGKSGQTLLLNTNGTMKAPYLLLVGIGKVKEVTPEKICQAAATAAKLAEQ